MESVKLKHDQDNSVETIVFLRPHFFEIFSLLLALTSEDWHAFENTVGSSKKKARRRKTWLVKVCFRPFQIKVKNNILITFQFI